MIRLHFKFLHVRQTTDVLTFVLENNSQTLQAEVYVCVDTARRQAKEHRVSVRNEIVRLCIHGALHAAGFDDHEADDRAQMWQRQEAIVANVNV